MVNLNNYDMILGTPFMFQHYVAVGLNLTRISVGLAVPVDTMKGENTIVLASVAA